MKTRYDLPHGVDEIHSACPTREGKDDDEYIEALEDYITKMEKAWLEVRNVSFGVTRFTAIEYAEKFIGEHPHKHRPQEYG